MLTIITYPTQNEIPKPKKPRYQASLRYGLGCILAFIALNAFGGGYYGLTGAPNVPSEWLEGSPFHDYFIPSLILFIIVGGAFMTAAIAVFAGFRRSRWFAVGAGVILLGWIVIQVAIIGYVSWMQPAMAVTAVVVLMLAGCMKSSN